MRWFWSYKDGAESKHKNKQNKLFKPASVARKIHERVRAWGGKRAVIRVHRHKDTHSLPDTMREWRAQGRIRNISCRRHPLIFSKYGLSGMINVFLLPPEYSAIKRGKCTGGGEQVSVTSTKIITINIGLTNPWYDESAFLQQLTTRVTLNFESEVKWILLVGTLTLILLTLLTFIALLQGRNRKIFLRGKSHFSWFFSPAWIFPVENFHFGRPKTNFSGFEKWEKKKKKEGSSPHFVIFPPSIFNFPPSLLHFYLLFF